MGAEELWALTKGALECIGEVHQGVLLECIVIMCTVKVLGGALFSARVWCTRVHSNDALGVLVRCIIEANNLDIGENWGVMH
ncbi:hypothetical protein FNV43_RR01674 [Rhamnella rubrinervis]|uniref:Uncharacterized protein n=1 Tax=Rhamnella rubrinervis TaxID=2594499 RepID=A0A8K0HQ95_9ROSA|nr:hypothetical protein FNV43_RR01674 [Rhamnella rubrinervis]